MRCTERLRAFNYFTHHGISLFITQEVNNHELYNTLWSWPELKCGIPTVQFFLVYFVAAQIPVSHSSPVFLVTPMTKSIYFLGGLLDVG